MTFRIPLLSLASFSLLACSPMMASNPAMEAASGGDGGYLQLPPSSAGSSVPTPFDSSLPEREIWVAKYGDDENAGTLFEPKATISAALAIATPGTAIMIKAGTYDDYLVFQEFEGGAAGKPLWLRSADGYGAAKLVSQVPDREVVRVNGTRFLVIEGFHIQGTIELYPGVPPPGSPMGAIGNPAFQVIVQNNLIESAKPTVIDVRNSDGIYILGNEINAGGANAIQLNTCLGCYVDGNTY